MIHRERNAVAPERWRRKSVPARECTPVDLPPTLLRHDRKELEMSFDAMMVVILIFLVLVYEINRPWRKGKECT